MNDKLIVTTDSSGQGHLIGWFLGDEQEIGLTIGSELPYDLTVAGESAQRTLYRMVKLAHEATNDAEKDEHAANALTAAANLICVQQKIRRFEGRFYFETAEDARAVVKAAKALVARQIEAAAEKAAGGAPSPTIIPKIRHLIMALPAVATTLAIKAQVAQAIYEAEARKQREVHVNADFDDEVVEDLMAEGYEVKTSTDRDGNWYTIKWNPEGK